MNIYRCACRCRLVAFRAGLTNAASTAPALLSISQLPRAQCDAPLLFQCDSRRRIVYTAIPPMDPPNPKHTSRLVVLSQSSGSPLAGGCAPHKPRHFVHLPRCTLKLNLRCLALGPETSGKVCMSQKIKSLNPPYYTDTLRAGPPSTKAKRCTAARTAER